MGMYRIEEKGIPMSVVTATPPAGIANANQSNSRKVLLSVRDVLKVYGSREAVTRALDDVSFDICEGEFVGVMGPSGSGKSTLLNCISTIDTVTSGSIILNGRDIAQLRHRQLSKFRRDDLGFIFQDANLLDTLTGFENIALALTIKGEKADAVRTKVERTANSFGRDGRSAEVPATDVGRPASARGCSPRHRCRSEVGPCRRAHRRA